MINFLILLFFISCTNHAAFSKNNRDFKEIKLLVDKNKILANGVDFCKFEVKDSENKSVNASIYVDSERIGDNKFSTLKKGNYSFFAIFNNVKSNIVEVEAFEVRDENLENKAKEYKKNENEDRNELDYIKEMLENGQIFKINKELEIYNLFLKGEVEELNLEMLKDVEIAKAIEDNNGMNLLCAALADIKNFDLLMKILEEKNMEINFKAVDENGNSFLHFLLTIEPLEDDENFELKWEELLNKFKEITQNYFIDLLAIKNRDGLNPFYISLYLKNINRFELLIKNVNISRFFLEKDDKGKTLSHYLVEIMEDAEEFTKFFNILSTNSSFNLNYLSYKNIEGNSALIEAIILEKHDIAKVLAKIKNHKNEYIKLSINYIKEKCKVDDEYIDELLE